MDFSIREIYPHIYHLRFGSGYDAAMHFLRFQEYYESPKFHKRIFALVEYMEWYAKRHGEGSFTYPNDWSGFNDPSWVLDAVRDAEIPDPNKYDRFMFNLIDIVREKEKDHPYYFIGTSEESSDGAGESEVTVLDHEIAHAFFTVRKEYRDEVITLLNTWGRGPGHKGEELDSARDVLISMGYHPSTIDDEIHAYCATGLCDDLKGVISKKEMKPFQRLFKREFTVGAK